MIQEIKHIVSSLQILFIGDFHTYWFQLSVTDFVSIIKLLVHQTICYTLYRSLLLFEYAYELYRLVVYLPFIHSIIIMIKKAAKSMPVIGTICKKLYCMFKPSAYGYNIEKLSVWKYHLESVYWKKLIDKSIKNKNAHIRLVITGDLNTENEVDLTGLKFIMSNHRSIFDYVLLQYIFQNSNDIGVHPKYMFTWGKIIKIPGFQTILNVFQKNENYKLKTFENEDNYNKFMPLILFPEVNVMTKEVKIVHDKLCVQNGTRVYKECLSPRYDSLLQLIEMIEKSKSIDDNYFYNVTLTYYKLEAILEANDEHICLAHKQQPDYGYLKNPLSWYKLVLDFNQRNQTNQEKSKQQNQSKCKYQLLQIIPSLVECFFAFNRTEKQPLIIRVHIEKIPMSIFKDKSKKKIELFLENKFASKDDIIQQFENGLKVKKTRKRSLKTSSVTSIKETCLNIQNNETFSGGDINCLNNS